MGHWKSTKTDTVSLPSPKEMAPVSELKVSLASGVGPGAVAWLLRFTTTRARTASTTTTAAETPITNQLVLLFAAAMDLPFLSRPRPLRARPEILGCMRTHTPIVPGETSARVVMMLCMTIIAPAEGPGVRGWEWASRRRRRVPPLPRLRR